MKHFLTQLAALLFTLGVTLAQTESSAKTSPTASKTGQELKQLYQKWDEAQVKVDLKTLEQLYAEEYTVTGSDGLVTPRAEVIADLKSGADVVSFATTDDFKFTFLGDTVIANVRWNAKETYKGQDTSGSSRWTDVWVRRDGRWQVVASHGSRIESPEAEARQELTKIQKEWDEAGVKADIKTLDRILGDDYVGTDPDGRIFTKKESLDGTKSGEEVVNSASTDDLKITVYGNVAVVTGTWKASGKSKGGDWSGTHRFTDTWVKRAGRWQVVADHWTKTADK